MTVFASWATFLSLQKLLQKIFWKRLKKGGQRRSIVLQVQGVFCSIYPEKASSWFFCQILEANVTTEIVCKPWSKMNMEAEYWMSLRVFSDHFHRDNYIFSFTKSPYLKWHILMREIHNEMSFWGNVGQIQPTKETSLREILHLHLTIDWSFELGQGQEVGSESFSISIFEINTFLERTSF